MTRTEFLRRQTVECKDKIARAAMPFDELDMSGLDVSLHERKAYGIAKILETMPLNIAEKELIVGTRTWLVPNDGNEDGHDASAYSYWTCPKYVNEKDIEFFTSDESFFNKSHRTPDYSILLEKGVYGIIKEAQDRLARGGLSEWQEGYLRSIIISYEGMASLITRYSLLAGELAERETDVERKGELERIRDVCGHIAHNPARDFYEAVQLFFFGHLSVIIENNEFIAYGRLDMIFGKYLDGYPEDEARQLIDCLVIKMYDQADLKQTYLNRYSAQLNVTLGGVDREGNDAVNSVTYMFLDAISRIRLSEPLVALRINSKNPEEFLTRSCELAVSGINTLAFYNDDLFIDSLTSVGIAVEDAREYGFDLCQDINIPGKGDFFCCFFGLVPILLEYIPTALDVLDFDSFIGGFKRTIAEKIDTTLTLYSETYRAFREFYDGNYDYYFDGLSKGTVARHVEYSALMMPVPMLSALYHGTIESAMDVSVCGCEIKNKGAFFGTPTEAMNSIAAIKKLVFDTKTYSLREVWDACQNNFEGQNGETIRARLINAPKWGNDDEYVDSIAQDLLEFACREITKHKNYEGSRWLAGIHQPHPVLDGKALPATPDGRRRGEPVAVSMSPANGTVRNGPLAALKSAAKIDHRAYQWNFCVMLSYHKGTTFKGNEGAEILHDLIKAYFEMGGTQHQPNISDVEQLKAAQKNPEMYRDLIVRLWGVSVNFVDIPKDLQDEVIERYI